MEDRKVLLACLLYDIHSCFYDVDVDIYCSAMSEFSKISNSLGCNVNDIAKIVQGV